jgi:hypothetical protein
MKNRDKEKLSDSVSYPEVKNKDQGYNGSGSSINPADLPKRDIKTYEEIANTLRIDIPLCKKIPINGRIFVIERPGTESKTPGGLFVSHKFRSKKGEEVEFRNVNRFFVVCWDPDGIPEDIRNKLHIGIEVSPFLPQEAEEWTIPIIIDFETGNQFGVLHYNELAGISETLPEKIDR